MKLPAILKSISLIEIVVIVVFVLYIIFPVPTPSLISPYVESPLGMVSILLVLIYLFLNSNPILAVLFIFVGYELLRRSGKNGPIIMTPTERRTNLKPVTKPTLVTNIQQSPNSDPMPMGTGPTNAYIQYTQSSFDREREIRDANIPLNQPLLEVDVVREMAPVGKSDTIQFTASGFKPVADNLKGAANF
jgi:hypothetical protein